MLHITRSILALGLLIGLGVATQGMAQDPPTADPPTTPKAAPSPAKPSPAAGSIFEKLAAISAQTDWLEVSDLSPVAQKLANKDTVLYPEGPLPEFTAADLTRWKLAGKWSWRGHSEHIPVVFTIEGKHLLLTRGTWKRYLGGEAGKNGILVLEYNSPKEEFPATRERLNLVRTPEGRLEGFNQSWSGDDTDPGPVRIFR